MKYFVVDAFAETSFSGNPAGICLIEEQWPADSLLQSIAFENNLSETAYVSKTETPYEYKLRWFTPTTEIDLCGHATLATSYVVSHFVDCEAQTMKFHTRSGELIVNRKGELYEMNFPSRKPTPVVITPEMQEAIGQKVYEAGVSRDLLLLVENQEQVKSIIPDTQLLNKVPDYALIVTAKSDEEGVDFVSRFFAPKYGVLEDPVCGSAHATLIPFWAEKLKKTKMIAKQLSKRGGTIYCEDLVERVSISGKANLFLQGEIKV